MLSLHPPGSNETPRQITDPSPHSAQMLLPGLTSLSLMMYIPYGAFACEYTYRCCYEDSIDQHFPFVMQIAMKPRARKFKFILSSNVIINIMERMTMLKKSTTMTAFALIISLTACGASGNNLSTPSSDVNTSTQAISSESEDADNTTDTTTALIESTIQTENAELVNNDTADSATYANDVPELYNGYSEYVGPWAYLMYARDESTSYTEHEYGDGYVPKAGDFIITGDEDDYWYFSNFDFVNATSLRRFPYGYASYVWNGHILYVSNVNDSGILTCYEGNSIAPNQKLEADDPDYIHKSSIDMIKLDFVNNTTVTASKPAEKPIRIVIETNFSPDFVAVINSYASELLTEFNENPDSVRQMLMSYYVQDVDWCGLYLHHLLLTAKERM